MAVKLMKLVMSATTSTTAVPTVYRYFYSASAAINATSLFIDNSKFFKDDGNEATAIVTQTADNGFYLLFINGELQQSALYTVAASGVTIADTPAFTIPESAPITLAVTNFAPDSTTTVTT